ncbi:hypothetical protein DFH27DRAFT_645216 [Peziza echinospora]|nr:hypothetical protein DFH27DRAFT_645216 [Peziza echinospora]
MAAPRIAAAFMLYVIMASLALLVHGPALTGLVCTGAMPPFYPMNQPDQLVLHRKQIQDMINHGQKAALEAAFTLERTKTQVMIDQSVKVAVEAALEVERIKIHRIIEEKIMEEAMKEPSMLMKGGEFIRLDNRFNQMNNRFNQMDARFGRMDIRMDARLDREDSRVEGLQKPAPTNVKVGGGSAEVKLAGIGIGHIWGMIVFLVVCVLAVILFYDEYIPRRTIRWDNRRYARLAPGAV